MIQKGVSFWRNIWGPPGEISERFVRSSAIVVFERVVTKLLQFVRTIILARLLFPEDFGLFGLAAISLGLLEVFLQSGFNAALIHEKGKVEEYLNVAWTVQVLRNFFVACLVFLTAPIFGDFFAHPEIVPLIRVLAVAFAIDGFVNIGAVLFQKDLDYRKRFLYDMSFVITEIVVVIVAAYILRSPWALVVGVLANRVASVVFSYVLHPYRPRFEFDLIKLKHLFSYGKWVGMMSIVSYLVVQGDNLAIGKFLGAEQLGYYQPAYALALIPVAEFGRVLGGTLFPMFAKLNADVAVLREAFIRSLRIVLSFTAPVCLGLFMLADDFVPVVYGEKWTPMIPIVSVLSIYALIKIFESVAGPFLLGIGKPKHQAIATIIQLVSMMLVILPFIHTFGVIGAAYAVLLGGLVSLIYLLVVLIRALALPLLSLSLVVIPVLAALFLMIVTLHYVEEGVSLTHGSSLVFGILLGGFSYLFVILLVDKLCGAHLLSSLRWIRHNI
jgi:lipopolysaccharide exporter